MKNKKESEEIRPENNVYKQFDKTMDDVAKHNAYGDNPKQEVSGDKTEENKRKLTSVDKARIINSRKNKCQNPNCNNALALKVHHIDGNHSNDKENNLIVLCANCHDLADSGTLRANLLREWIKK